MSAPMVALLLIVMLVAAAAAVLLARGVRRGTLPAPRAPRALRSMLSSRFSRGGRPARSSRASRGLTGPGTRGSRPGAGTHRSGTTAALDASLRDMPDPAPKSGLRQNRPARRRVVRVASAQDASGLRAALAAAAARVVPRPGGSRPAGAAGGDGIDFGRRLFAIGAVVSAMFGALIARLWGMQLINSQGYSDQAEANLTRDVSIKAPRGRILDRNGDVLVGNKSVMALVADSSVADDTRVVRRISNLLGMPPVAVRRAIQDATASAQSARTVMADIPQTAVAYVTEHPAQFPRVSVDAQYVREYPYGPLACHLLGYTGAISDLDAYNQASSDGLTYQPDDVVGLTGVELQYEEVLQGVRGTRVVHVDADGDVTGVVGEIPAERGSDLMLTIDLTMQQAAENAIQHGIAASEALNYAATGGAVVALNCKTGEVLAMASYPNYNPSSFVDGIGADLWSRLQAPDVHTPMLNRAVNGLYPPASTVKPLTTLAGLEHGVCSQGSSYTCKGWWTGLGDAYGKWCWEHSGHGEISVEYGIAMSCDVVFYEISKALYYSDTTDGLQEMFRRWGLGAATGVDIPGESQGRVPDGKWKWDWYTSAADADRAWQPGDTVNIAIGQGDMLVTPLQLAYAYSGLVSHGTQMWPHVLRRVLSSQSGSTIAQAQEHIASQVTIDADDLAFVNEALQLVLSSQIGLNVYFANVPVTVGGKSGTGEAGDDPTNPHAWFVAAAPMEDPQYVVASFVEHGGGGGDIATSMCAEVLAAAYGNGPLDYIEINRRRGVSSNTGLGVGA